MTCSSCKYLKEDKKYEGLCVVLNTIVKKLKNM